MHSHTLYHPNALEKCVCMHECTYIHSRALSHKGHTCTHTDTHTHTHTHIYIYIYIYIYKIEVKGMKKTRNNKEGKDPQNMSVNINECAYMHTWLPTHIHTENAYLYIYGKSKKKNDLHKPDVFRNN